MNASPEKTTDSQGLLQLLLFVDRRMSSREQLQQIQAFLKELRTGYPFELQVVDVAQEPYLAEHFRLIATPALIKIHPDPRETLAGTNLVQQLERRWEHWQRSVDDYLVIHRPTHEAQPSEENNGSAPAAVSSIAHSAEKMRLSEEIFRLKQEKAELQEQLQFKDQVIAILAHDLRNPLTAASIALETLDSKFDPYTGFQPGITPQLTAQLIKHARNQTRIIKQMIAELLQASRNANAEFHIQPQKLDLRTLCENVLEDLTGRFEEKSQQVKQDIPSDLPFVFADSARLRQVLVNLLENAIKYTPEGGKIQLCILHRTLQKVQVSIYDNGPGIPEENQKRIFEDRFRLKRDEMKDGYGIGLAVCKRIISAHYGQIWVNSAPNEGSCFNFTLPVYRT